MQRSMSRLPKRTIALAAVAGVLVALLSVFVFQVPATAAGVPTSTARTPQGASTYHEQFSGWSYNATVADGNVKVAVEYDKNKSGIEAFDAANRQLVGQVAGPSSLTIVFRRPLSISEFQDLVGKTGIQVASYPLRGVDGKGTRSTFSFSPQGKNLVPQALLGQLTKNAHLSPAWIGGVKVGYAQIVMGCSRGCHRWLGDIRLPDGGLFPLVPV